MASITLTVLDTPGLTLYAFPTNQSLASWTTYRVLMTGSSGRYTCTIDDTNGMEWGIYVGASAPATYDLARWTQQYGDMAGGGGSVNVTVEDQSITLG
jgi:hypothetical protein